MQWYSVVKVLGEVWRSPTRSIRCSVLLFFVAGVGFRRERRVEQRGEWRENVIVCDPV